MDFGVQIGAALTSQLGEERYELWFADVALLQTEEAIRVAARTPFSLERLKKDFHHHIQLALQDIGKQDVPLEYVVDAESVDLFQSDVESKEERKEKAAGSESVSDESLVSTNVAVEQVASAPAQPRKRQLILAKSKPARGRRFRTLDSFQSGDCNQLASTSIEMVLSQPGEINPLLLHGPTGVGKTHLVEGIWCRARKQRRSRVVYLSAEQFTTYFVEALRGDGLPNFRRKYRQADVLIIDDIQFFQGKQATLVELAYTIDELSRDHRQLVLTADRPPAQLANCVGRDIANRLSGGLVCAMKPIDQQTMEAISQRWARDRKLMMSPELHSTIATRAQGDARQLAGVLNRLQATTFASGEPVTMRMVNEIVYELLPAQSRVIRLKDVHKAVCEMFGIELESLHQKSRSKAITQPRMLAMYLSKKYTTAGLHEISEFYGRRSHSSAVTANNSVQDWLEAAKTIQINGQLCDVRDVVSQLEQKLRAG